MCVSAVLLHRLWSLYKSPDNVLILSKTSAISRWNTDMACCQIAESSFPAYSLCFGGWPIHNDIHSSVCQGSWCPTMASWQSGARANVSQHAPRRGNEWGNWHLWLWYLFKEFVSLIFKIDWWDLLSGIVKFLVVGLASQFKGGTIIPRKKTPHRHQQFNLWHCGLSFKPYLDVIWIYQDYHKTVSLHQSKLPVLEWRGLYIENFWFIG